MRKIISIVLAVVLLASAVSLVITPAAALYETRIPFAGEDNELTKEELVNAILPYMLDEETYTLDDVGDATWVYAYWDGKPKTVKDQEDRTVTLYRPVERIVDLVSYSYEPLRTLKSEDKLVALDSGFKEEAPRIYFGELCDLPGVGHYATIDYEMIIALKPDLVITWSTWYGVIIDKLESADPNLPIFATDFGCNEAITFHETMRTFGDILAKEDEAEEFIDWQNGIIDFIKARTDELSDDEKPRVLYGDFKKGNQEWYTMGSSGTFIGIHYIIENIAGGRNIGAGTRTSYRGLEWVIERNPDIIIRYDWRGGYWRCYTEDDLIQMKAHRNEVQNHPTLVGAGVTAVTNETVYALSLTFKLKNAIGAAYFAKILHPDLFSDMDPKEIHQEFLTRFQRIDYDLDEHGAFVYPPLED